MINEVSADLLQKLLSHISPVFQFTANLLGSRLSAKIQSHRLLVFAPKAFLVMYFGADKIHLTDKISLHRIYWLVVIG